MPEMSEDDLSSHLAASRAALDQSWSEARGYLLGPQMERLDAVSALCLRLAGDDPAAWLRSLPDPILAMVGELASLAAQRMGCEAAARMLEGEE